MMSGENVKTTTALLPIDCTRSLVQARAHTHARAHTRMCTNISEKEMHAGVRRPFAHTYTVSRPRLFAWLVRLLFGVRTRTHTLGTSSPFLPRALHSSKVLSDSIHSCSVFFLNCATLLMVEDLCVCFVRVCEQKPHKRMRTS
jgi:hypothetical protein